MVEHRPTYQGFTRTTFDQESNIHVLASALDGFFRDLYSQPPLTWISTLKEGILMPFVTRPDAAKACLFGERNPKASSLVHDERPQNWLAWFMPLLTHDDGKWDVLKPTFSLDQPESLWSIGLLLTIACLHWAFSNRPPEVFVNMIADVRTKFEQLGWDELNCARVRRILTAFVTKINNSKNFNVKTDSQQLKFLENSLALCGCVEDFVFFSPLYGFNTKPESGVCGLHADHSGLLDTGLLKCLLDCIQVNGQAEVINGLDKKDVKEFKKRLAMLEDVKSSLRTIVDWAIAAANFLAQKSERAWVAGRADGLHVVVGDRVLVKQPKQAESHGTVAHKGTVGSSVQLGVIFDEPVQGGTNGTFFGRTLFSCAEGCGLLVKPEHAFSQEDVGGKQEYDRLATAVIENVSKRPKGNKKQVREVFDEFLKPNRSKREAAKKSLESTTLSASFADVPYDVCMEQAKFGGYSLRRMVRYLTKIHEAKTAYLTVLDKTNAEEGTKQMGDQMELFVQGQKSVVHIEHGFGLRERQFLAEVTSEVLTPFQALEKDYETAVTHFKLQHTTVEKTIETTQAGLAKDLAECEKELHDLRKFKFEIDTGKRTGNDLAKYSKQLQSTATKAAQYEAASQRFKEETFPNLKRTQRQLRTELQTTEQRRLLCTQVYLQRYLTACETLTSPFPQLKHFGDLIADLSPPVDISVYVALNRRPEVDYFVTKTSCTAYDIMQGNLSAATPSSPRSPPPPPDSSRTSISTLPPLTLAHEESPTVRSPRSYRTWGRSNPATPAPPIDAKADPPHASHNDSSCASLQSDVSDSDMSNHSTSSPNRVSNHASGRPEPLELSDPPGPPAGFARLASSESFSAPRRQSLDGNTPLSPRSEKTQARSVVGLAQAMKGGSVKLSLGSHSSNLAPGSPPCTECKCFKFSPSLMKKAKCSNCNHVHVTAPKMEA